MAPRVLEPSPNPVLRVVARAWAMAALACLLGVGAREVRAQAALEGAGTTAPSSTVLDEAVRLDPHSGHRGSLDPRGWRWVSGSDGAPRFERVTPRQRPFAPDAARARVEREGRRAFPPRPFDSQPASGPDGVWGATFETQGLDGNVYALVVDGAGNLYAGGAFSHAGGVVANGIAKWDGHEWSALGTGMNDIVLSLAVDAAGHVYAGGWFTTAGGVAAQHVARWDGTSWAALGEGVDAAAQALAVDGAGRLYAAGGFTLAGTVIANGIAKWDGVAWSALGSGMDFAVYALAVDHADNLYAGGYFTLAGGIPANSIAKWNGSAWSALGTGIDNSVYALALDAAGHVYAGGDFSSAGGIEAYGIAKWNGVAWSALGGGLYGPAFALAADTTGNLYVGGGFTSADGVVASCTAKWDGGEWRSLGTGMTAPSSVAPYVAALALDGVSGRLHAGGAFASAGGTPSSNIAVMGALFPILASGDAHGSIEPSGCVMLARDGSATFRVVPAPGYRVEDVIVDGVSVGQRFLHRFASVREPHTISATFTSLALGVEGGPAGEGPILLAPARPNPFRTSTTLRFSQARAGHVDLRVYAVDGRAVRTLSVGEFDPGEHRVEWDGRDDAGHPLREGVYFVRLVTPQVARTRVVELLR